MIFFKLFLKFIIFTSNDLKWSLQNFYTKFLMFVFDVKYGSNFKSYGITFFRKSKNSKIIIGDNCVFRSSNLSNLIGINHSNILSTHGKSTITIGNNCGFSGISIGAFSSIKLGDNVRCGSNVIITDGDWHESDNRSNSPKSILINDNVWIGEGVKILKGVIIGKNSIIGMGSIVSRNIPENVIAVGNPCKVIKRINNDKGNKL